MNPKITVIVKGEQIDERQAESALSSISGLQLKKMEEQRGVGMGIAKAVKWVGEIIGDTGKIADGLIEQASKQFAGASLEIQVTGMTIKVTNASRSQLLVVMDKAIQAAKDAGTL